MARPRHAESDIGNPQVDSDDSHGLTVILKTVTVININVITGMSSRRIGTQAVIIAGVNYMPFATLLSAQILEW